MKTVPLPFAALALLLLLLGGIAWVTNAGRARRPFDPPVRGEPEVYVKPESRLGVAAPAEVPASAPGAGRKVLSMGSDSGVATVAIPSGNEAVTLVGRVVDHFGNAVSNLPLQLVNARGERLDFVTDTSGLFAYESTHVMQSARPHSPEWVVDRLLTSATGETLVRVRRPGRVVLSVVDVNGAPVPAFVATALRVELATRDLQDEVSARGAAGTVELAVAPGFIQVLLTVPERLPEWVTHGESGERRMLNVTEGNVMAVDYRLTPAMSTIALEVVDAQGRPVEGVAVTPALTIGQLAHSEGLGLTTGLDGRAAFGRPDSLRDLGLGSFLRFEHAELGASVRFVHFDEHGAALIALARKPEESRERGEILVAAGASGFTLMRLGPLELPLEVPNALSAGASTFVYPGLYLVDSPPWNRTLQVHPGLVHKVPDQADKTCLVVTPDPHAGYAFELPVVLRSEGRGGAVRRTRLGSEPLEVPCGNVDEPWELRVGGRLAPSCALLPFVVTGRGAQHWQVPATQHIDVLCTDDAGHPMERLIIEVGHADGGTTAITIVTDADGAAVCFGEPGSYMVSLAGEQGLAATSVVLRHGTNAEAHLVVAREPGRILGRVVGAQLLPLPAAAVIVAPLHSSDAEIGARRIKLLFVADDRGEFRTDALLPGPYQIAAFRGVNALQNWPPLVSEEIVLLPGEERSLVLVTEQ